MVTLPKYIETSVEDIDEAYTRLAATFASHKTQDLAWRLFNLKQLAFFLTDNVEAITTAIGADLGKGAYDAEMSDLWPPLNEIELAVKRLPEWIKDEPATRDANLAFKLARPRVVKQPKGVSLIIGAWNYPWNLTVGPLVGAIAAGCPCIIKMSEHAPATAALFAELLPRYCDPDSFAVVLGGPEASTQLLKKRWGHILYTGNGAVGKIVAEAAAKTLTPTTLELGGKSPVIVTSDADLKITARRMLSVKQLNVGQMCVSPDYILCAKDRVDDLTAEIVATLKEFYPAGSERSLLGDWDQSCALRNTRDFNRITGALDDAESKGKVIFRAESDAARNRMGISVVRFNKGAQGETSLFLEEEIFGPVLPIIPVDSVEAAIDYVNKGPTPLALYVCSSNRAVFDRCVKETLSGSAIWNDFILAPASRTTPFGGVGESGWGAYHGYDGFLTFSHRKAVIEIPLWLEIAQKGRYPPNSNEKSKRMMKRVLTSRITWKRPVSVEHERRALTSARNRKRAVIGLLLVLLGAWAGVKGPAAIGHLSALTATVRQRLGL